MNEATDDSKPTDEVSTPVQLFEVRCRVHGNLQGYQIYAVDHEQARAILLAEIQEAQAVLVLIN